MEQIYEKYDENNHEVWQLLFNRQVKNLKEKACTEYLECLDGLKDVLNNSAIPDFKLLDKALLDSNGWSIEVVPGLIPVEDFLNLLSQRKFCSSTWLRSKSQLDYLEEPDMFHDIFGHIPLLMNSDYANFIQKFGELSLLYNGKPDAIELLKRFYWFTIEFGLINDNDDVKIYGSGIVSSFQESNTIFENNAEIYPFELDKVLGFDFSTDEIQSRYFKVDSLKYLYESLNNLEDHLQE